MSLGCRWLALGCAVRAGVCRSWSAAAPPPCSSCPSPLRLSWAVAGHQKQRCLSSETPSTRGEGGGGGGGGGSGKPEGVKMKRKSDPRARPTIGSVGRRIHQRHLQVLDEDGKDLGTMDRIDVLRLLDQKGLKLVSIDSDSDPPLYRLMSGKQIHEEQLKLREKQKARAGPTQVKELTLLVDIGEHDLDTKLRQVSTWLDRKHHVRLTLQRNRRSSDTQPLDSALDKMVERMTVPVGFVSKTKMIRDGRSAMCILRSPTVKELRQQEAPSAAPPSKPKTKQDSDGHAHPSPPAQTD